jgi:uncharacterized small protein (DUF1192 family)
MDKLTRLSFLRKQYLELTKLFFYEIQKGRSLQEVGELKQTIDATLVEINHLEAALNLKKEDNNPGG